MVVLSPPGRIRPSNSSRSLGRRTSMARAPSASTARTCSMKAPCIATTPIVRFENSLICPPGLSCPTCHLHVGHETPRLPAADRHQLALGDLADLYAAHRLAE